VPDSGEFWDMVREQLVEDLGVAPERIFAVSAATGQGVTELVSQPRASLAVARHACGPWPVCVHCTRVAVQARDPFSPRHLSPRHHPSPYPALLRCFSSGRVLTLQPFPPNPSPMPCPFRSAPFASCWTPWAPRRWSTRPPRSTRRSCRSAALARPWRTSR
jgi:hypothetical protein